MKKRKILSLHVILRKMFLVVRKLNINEFVKAWVQYVKSVIEMHIKINGKWINEKY